MITTSTNIEAIHQKVYNDMLQESFEDNILGMGLFSDMSAAFPHGDELNVSQIGQVTLTDYSEDSPLDFKSIDTSRITLSVTDYPADAFYMTDKAKQDMAVASEMFRKRVKQSLYAFDKALETDIYQACNDVQTAADTNTISGREHRKALASGATAQNVIDAIADIKWSFDKANVPEVGRILIVDSSVENKLNKGTQVVSSDNPQFRGIIETGFARNHRFVRNIHGFDIFVSNLLPAIASETVDSVAVTSGVCNIAMCVADDDCKPVMGVIRQSPSARMARDDDNLRDKWYATARWGFSTYRPESVYCLLTQFS